MLDQVLWQLPEDTGDGTQTVPILGYKLEISRSGRALLPVTIEVDQVSDGSYAISNCVFFVFMRFLPFFKLSLPMRFAVVFITTRG